MKIYCYGGPFHNTTHEMAHPPHYFYIPIPLEMDTIISDLLTDVNSLSAEPDYQVAIYEFSGIGKVDLDYEVWEVQALVYHYKGKEPA